MPLASDPAGTVFDVTAAPTADTATAVTLVALHLLAAVVVVPTVGRALRTSDREPAPHPALTR